MDIFPAQVKATLAPECPYRDRGGWIQTYTGKRFHYEDPRPQDIDILDIAHALSMLCRYAGHTSRFYSVAEHSVLVSREFARRDLALAGLLHDATEAYCADVPRPLKKLLPVYRHFEDGLWQVIAAKFDLEPELPSAIHDIDTRMLITERPQLFARPDPWPGFENVKPLEHVVVKGWSPDFAKVMFLERFEELTA